MGNRGSILLDQMVALALLGLLVVSTFSLLTTGTLAAHLARESSVAGGLAAQKLEETLASEPAEVRRQLIDPVRFPRYEWQVSVMDADGPFQRVAVTVWWPLRNTMRSVTLTTLVRREDE